MSDATTLKKPTLKSLAAEMRRLQERLEDMEDARVDHGPEGSSERFELHHVADHEGRHDAARRGLLASLRDRGRGNVDADCFESSRGEKQRVLASPATGVEHRRLDEAGVGESDECRLRPTDVPGRRGTPVGRVPAGGAARRGWLTLHRTAA